MSRPDIASSIKQRRELDLLTAAVDVEVSPATLAELPAMVDMAVRSIPGVNVKLATVERIHRIDPSSIFAFRVNGIVKGGIAFLYLNAAGLDALILDELDISNPQFRFLARPGEEPAALYVWALAAQGRAVMGCATIAAMMREAPYSRADYYAQPATKDGLRFSKQVGLWRIPSLQRDLWTYRRLLNRAADGQAQAKPQDISVTAPAGRKPEWRQPQSERATTIRIARDVQDLMLVSSIRSAVYLAEQNCPYAEEFDGNDLVAAHFIGFIGDEPAACLRARFFADFAKVERLAVRRQFRRSTIAFKLVRACVKYLKRKGYTRIYGQAQDRLVDFWARFGAKPLGHNRRLVFSDYSYTEMLLELERDGDAITIDTDPYVIIRPEGEWDTPGVLDRSAIRPLAAQARELSAA